MADKPNVNPTPKQKFQNIGSTITAHRDLMQNVDLNRSIDVALLEMQRRQGSVTSLDVASAATNHFKIQGALEFISILRNLGETAELPKTATDHTQLKY